MPTIISASIHKCKQESCSAYKAVPNYDSLKEILYKRKSQIQILFQKYYLLTLSLCDITMSRSHIKYVPFVNCQLPDMI